MRHDLHRERGGGLAANGADLADHSSSKGEVCAGTALPELKLPLWDFAQPALEIHCLLCSHANLCLVGVQVAPALGQEQQGVIYSLFDAHVDAGLAWVHKQDSSYIPAVDSNMVTSLALIMQVRLGQTVCIQLLCRCTFSSKGYERYTICKSPLLACRKR